MIRLSISFFFFIITTIAASGQSNQGTPRQNFIILQNGQVITAGKVQFKSPLFKSNHFLLDDSLKYNIELINTYQNHEGYFRRIYSGAHLDAFAKRILEGPRISKYYSMLNHYDYDRYGYGYGMPRSTRRRVYFFSKDDGPLYELTLNNLEQALADNVSSMALLKQHRRNKLIHTGITVLGAGVLTYGILSSTNGQVNGYAAISPTVYAGVGILAVPFVIQLFQKDKLTQAMELYNYELKQ